MKHKKQAFEQIERTVQWNTTRGNTPDTLDWSLEVDMLQEELDELKLAISQNSPVGIFDALMDLEFVLRGTCGKFGLSPQDQVTGYEFVLKANETKSATKNSAGKITKPADFVGPEAELQKLLNSRGIH